MSMSFGSADRPLLKEGSQDGVFSVSELTQSVKFVLEEEFSSIKVSGEISNYRVASSGHAYFVLKDNASQIKCVLFRGQKRFLKFEPEDGMEVMLSGSLAVYAPRGEYQIIASSLEPLGAGALQVAFEQLKNRLMGEGLFEQSLKKELPLFPEKIAIVTSPGGAAVQDILSVLNRRYPGVHIVIYPVNVQGESAGKGIAEGIDCLNSLPDIDVMIVGRGGGSIEDLWAFNEEVVARAIFRSRIPVISAVGHETDFTIADFTADLRAPTPSAAAELVVKDSEELKKSIKQMRERLSFLMLNRVAHLKEVVSLYSKKRVLIDPFARVYDFLQQVDDYNGRLNRAALAISRRYKDRVFHLSKRLDTLTPRNYIGQCTKVLVELEKRFKSAVVNDQRLRRKRLLEITGRLSSLSPLGTMERGYSICLSLPGKSVINDVGLVRKGDEVLVKLHSGELTCAVLDKHLTLPGNLENPVNKNG